MRSNPILAVLYSTTVAAAVTTINCNGKSYSYEEMAGYGYVPTDAYDKYFDTIGGIGSAISIPKSTWKKTAAGYTGIFWAQPDRGWNTEGTVNFQPRVQKFQVTLVPQPNATIANPSGPNVFLEYMDTILYTDPKGTPMTGLDADGRGAASFKGFPKMPVATYTGNGFGGSGPGGRRVPGDNEGLVVNSDGTFWVSDEYGPFIYKFSSTGQMIQAIRPPGAFIPRRNGSVSFSADSPTVYQDESDDVIPADPTSGRENNHGFEGLTASPDGKTLYVLLQAATVQDGGTDSSTEQYTRFLQYDVSGKKPVRKAEYVVQLPMYNTGSSNKVAAQSEMHYLSPTQFLVLARDSKAGNGQSSTESLYRHADIIDISEATDVNHQKYNCPKCTVAPDGVLMKGIKTAQYCPFLNYNDNHQLRRFGVHNGGNTDAGLLNEKWESLALVPVEGDGKNGEYFLFTMSDNDFITQNGHLNGGKYPYADNSGYNLDSQVLVFHVKLPKGTNPI